MALSHEQLNAFENLKWAREHEAPLSNRGFIKYKPELKTLRDVPEIEPAEGDFTFLAKGVDSLQECFNVRLNASVIEQFEKAKKRAVEDGHEISLGWNLPFWGDFQMCKGTPKTGGIKYFLLNSNIEILISNTSDIWGVSVRYLSSALWQYGHDLMRLQVHTLIKELSCYVPEDYHRLSRIDVCVDFMGKNLSRILKPSILEGVVVPARSRIGEGEGLSYYVKSGTLSTLTIGSKSSLELQIYDKAREISEKSITLTVRQEMSNFGETSNGVNGSPTLTKREIKTTVTAQDGETVILGGLNETKNTGSQAGLSFLPNWFGAKSNTNDTTEIILSIELKKTE